MIYYAVIMSWVARNGYGIGKTGLAVDGCCCCCCCRCCFIIGPKLMLAIQFGSSNGRGGEGGGGEGKRERWIPWILHLLASYIIMTGGRVCHTCLLANWSQGRGNLAYRTILTKPRFFVRLSTNIYDPVIGGWLLAYELTRQINRS